MFSVPMDLRVATMPPASRIAATSVEQLLMLQSDRIDPDESHNRRARAHAGALLQALKRLQAGLLDGRADESDLETLAELTRDLPPVDDVALRQVLLATAQLAAVELAHLEVAGLMPSKNI
jgi:hypothetical protein